MVQVYGMSDVAGLMVLEKQRSSFLGGGMGGSAREYREKIAEDIDQHIKATLETHYKDVLASLETYKDAIEIMVASLFEKENIDGDEVRQIIKDFEIENKMESRLNLEKSDLEIAEEKAKKAEAEKPSEPEEKTEETNEEDEK
jgi:cell division protease FtsH